MARSTFQSRNVQSTMFRPLLEVEMSKKCTPLWREAHVKVKMLKAAHARPLLKVQVWFCVAGARGSAPCQKWANREGFVAFPKTMAGMGDLQRICKDEFRMAGAVQETCSSEMLYKSLGRWFIERGCILEHQICGFAKMILRDRCSTSYDLASLLHGRRSTLRRWSGKIAKHIGTRPSALHSTFQFWRKSRRIAEDVSQNCFVFGVIKLRKSGRTASFSSLQTEDRQIDR